MHMAGWIARLDAFLELNKGNASPMSEKYPMSRRSVEVPDSD